MAEIEPGTIIENVSAWYGTGIVLPADAPEGHAEVVYEFRDDELMASYTEFDVVGRYDEDCADANRCGLSVIKEFGYLSCKYVYIDEKDGKVKCGRANEARQQLKQRAESKMQPNTGTPKEFFPACQQEFVRKREKLGIR